MACSCKRLCEIDQGEHFYFFSTIINITFNDIYLVFPSRQSNAKSLNARYDFLFYNYKNKKYINDENVFCEHDNIMLTAEQTKDLKYLYKIEKDDLLLKASIGQKSFIAEYLEKIGFDVFYDIDRSKSDKSIILNTK